MIVFIWKVVNLDKEIILINFYTFNIFRVFILLYKLVFIVL